MPATTTTLSGLLFYIGLLNFFPILDHPGVLISIIVIHTIGGFLLFRNKNYRRIGIGLVLSAAILITIITTIYVVALYHLSI